MNFEGKLPVGLHRLLASMVEFLVATLSTVSQSDQLISVTSAPIHHHDDPLYNHNTASTFQNIAQVGPPGKA